MHRQVVLVLDFGGQYTQLIARRIRELKVYCEIQPFNWPIEKIREMAPRGIVLSGGPSSVYEAGAPLVSPELFSLEAPKLGICYGVQLAAKLLGGRVEPAQKREYGRAHCSIQDTSDLFAGFTAGEEIAVWMSHGDRVEETPKSMRVIG